MRFSFRANKQNIGNIEDEELNEYNKIRMTAYAGTTGKVFEF